MKRYRKSIRHPESLRRHSRHREVTSDLTVDLHGHTADEAINRLREVISSNSNITVLVIHGKGTGTLRLQIRAFLSNNPEVKELKAGEDSRLLGGDGVTLFRI